MSLTVNGLAVASMRWTAGWSGPWVAELELQHGDLVMPSGPVAIASTEGIVLAGRVDSTHTGVFGEKRRARVVGGLGWGHDVRAQHYHSDIGLALQVLATTTGAEVGEAATVLLPKIVGTDFVRRAGPAGQIFTDAGVDWWVGLDGVTRVGLRLPAVPPTSLEILDWNPTAGTLSFTCGVLVEPGTILVDTRFGRLVVRQVEAEVSAGSVTGTLWVAEAAPDVGESLSELVDGLEAIALEATRAHYGRLYEYRVIAMAGDRVELNAVKRAAGMPDILPASVWGGISGYRATLTPASRVLVGFIGGDPSKPYVAAYEPPEANGWRPVLLELDAVGSVRIGELAPVVCFGPTLGALPIALGPPVVTAFAALATYVAALTAALVANPVLYTGFAAAMAAPGAALATALGLVGAAVPSKKVVSQ